jgi:hypothetical protein
MKSIAQARFGVGSDLALEYPALWGLIDVAVDGDPKILASRIALEISSPTVNQMALSKIYAWCRDSGQRKRRTGRSASNRAPQCLVNGLSGLDYHIAAWLVKMALGTSFYVAGETARPL